MKQKQDKVSEAILEIKKGNMGVAYIFVALIVMVGLLVYKVI